MKKTIMILCACAAVALAGCQNVPQLKSPADLKLQIGKACAVVQPTLVSIQAMSVPDSAQQVVFTELVKTNGLICDANANLDATTLKTFVDTTIPAALRVITLMPGDPAMKAELQIGLVAFQVALSAAMAQYGPAQ